VPRVLSYDRVSSSQQLSGDGLRRQAAAAQAWAERQGLTLDTSLVLRDEGKSASKGQHIQEGGALGRLLQMAQAGAIEPGTILAVEAIDRLSRLEPLAGLNDVVGRLINAGISIVTIEDGATYSADTLRDDSSKLIILIIKIQTAYEYSRRLGMRSGAAWQATRSQLASGGVSRPRIFCPAWCNYDEDTGFTINGKAEVVRMVFGLLRDRGAYQVAQYLNAAGIPSLSGKSWTHASVQHLATRNSAVYGDLTLLANRRGHTARQRRDAAGQGEQIIEGVLPVVVPRDEVMTVRALISSRRKSASHAGPIKNMRWLGQGITVCTCGSGCGVTMGGTAPNRIHYLKCRRRASDATGCKGLGYVLNDLAVHVLNRLQPAQLEHLVGGGTERQLATTQAMQLLDTATDRDALATQRLRNAEKALQEAIVEGWPLSPYQQALAQCSADAKDAEQGLALARSTLAQLRGDNAVQELQEPIKQLFRAVLAGEDTAEQRREVNRGLRRLGVVITLDPAEHRVGLQAGDGPVNWQPLAPVARRLALEEAMVNPSTVIELPDGVVHVAEGRPVLSGELTPENQAMLADESLWELTPEDQSTLTIAVETGELAPAS
jgi:DNA invertase Pin-like site-specific DNA recombinase